MCGCTSFMVQQVKIVHLIIYDLRSHIWITFASQVTPLFSRFQHVVLKTKPVFLFCTVYHVIRFAVAGL